MALSVQWDVKMEMHTNKVVCHTSSELAADWFEDDEETKAVRWGRAYIISADKRDDVAMKLKRDGFKVA